MTNKQPDSTALRTALWRALHVLADEPPHVIEDKVGYELIQPAAAWQERPDMKYTRRLRAAIVARARLIEDIALAEIAKGVKQYVLLGAGLDSFAQRNRQAASTVDIYEIDQADTLAWKREKLIENGYEIPANLHFIPVDFETSSWWDMLTQKGFDPHQKTVVSCTGLTLYLTKDAIADMLKKLTGLASGSTLVIAFYLPLKQLEEEDQAMQAIADKGAAASGTPFVSFFPVEDIIRLAEQSGLKVIRIITTKAIRAEYFKDRTDHLMPASGEFFLVAEIERYGSNHG